MPIKEFHIFHFSFLLWGSRSAKTNASAECDLMSTQSADFYATARRMRRFRVSAPHRMHQAELQHGQYDVVRLKLQFNSEAEYLWCGQYISQKYSAQQNLLHGLLYARTLSFCILPSLPRFIMFFLSMQKLLLLQEHTRCYSWLDGFPHLFSLV